MKLNEIDFEIKKIEILPGDVLILTCKEILTEQQRIEFEKEINSISIKNKIIVLESGMTLDK